MGFYDLPIEEQWSMVNNFPAQKFRALNETLPSIVEGDIAGAAMNVGGKAANSITEGIKRMALGAEEYGRSTTIYNGERVVGTQLTTAFKNLAKIEAGIAKKAITLGAYPVGLATAGVGAVSMMNNSATGYAMGAIGVARGAMNVNYANAGFTRRERVQMEHKYNMGASGDMVFAMHNAR